MKKAIKLIVQSVAGMLLGLLVALIIFRLFAAEILTSPLVYNDSLSLAVVALIMWVPYTVYMGIIWYNEAITDCERRSESFQTVLKKVAILQFFNLLLCLFGVGMPNLLDSYLILVIGGFTPLTYWIPNVFLASLPVLLFNGVLYMVVYAGTCRRWRKQG